MTRKILDPEKTHRRATARIRAAAKVLYTVQKRDDDALVSLQQVALVRTALDDTQDDLVTLARSAGASWPDIADALGVSRQAAWRRYSRA